MSRLDREAIWLEVRRLLSEAKSRGQVQSYTVELTGLGAEATAKQGCYSVSFWADIVSTPETSDIDRLVGAALLQLPAFPDRGFPHGRQHDRTPDGAE